MSDVARKKLTKTKVIYFIQDLEVGGAEKLLLQFIHCLDKNRFEIILLTLTRKGPLFCLIPPFVKIYSTMNPFKILGILRKEKPDIFHSHLWRADFIGIPLAKLSGVSFCFSTRHNVNYFRGFKCFLVPLDAFIMSFTKTVFSVSDAVKNYYQKNFLYRRVNFFTIFNGINRDHFRELSKVKENRKINLLTVATLTVQKGHQKFLEVLAALKETDFEWHLVGCGPCEKDIRKKVQSLKMESKVLFHGMQEDVKRFYEKADLFILPSLWEGFGLVLIEAMCCGVPVFAARVDGVKEILKHRETAILFDWENIPEAVKNLRELMENRGLQEELVKKAKEESKKYDIRHMAKCYAEKYGEFV